MVLCALALTLPATARAAEFVMVPDADGASSGVNAFRKPLSACDATWTGTNKFQAIDEDIDAYSGACPDYVYGETPGTGAVTVWQEFSLTNAPAGAYTVNSLNFRFRYCSETASDPSLTMALFHSGGVSIGTRTFNSYSGCAGSSEFRYELRDLSLTKAELDSAYVRVTIAKPAGSTGGTRIHTINVEGNYCTANLCGVARNSADTTSLPWAGCPGIGVVSIVVNGAAPTTVNCDAAGEFTYAGAVPAGALVTAYLTDATRPTQRGVTYFRATGVGESLEIIRDRTQLESTNGTSLTNAHLSTWDYTNAPAWIPIDVTGTTLTETYPTTLEVTESQVPAGTYRPGGDVTVSSIVTEGYAQADSHTITLTSSGVGWACSGAIGTHMPYCTSFWGMTGTAATFRFTGSAATEVRDQSYLNLDLAPVSGNPTFTSTNGFNVGNNLTLGGGGGNARIDLNNSVGNVNVSGDVTINAGSQVTGSDTHTITVGRHMTGAGVFSSSGSGSLVLRGSTALRNFGPTAAATTWTINALELSSSGGGSTEIEVPVSGTGDIAVLNDLTVSRSGDSASTIFDADAFDRTIDVTGDLVINPNGTLLAPSSDSVVLRDNLTKLGTLTHNGGTVSIVPTADGTSRLAYASATTFANLSITGPGRVEFDSVDQTNVTAAFNVGSSGCAVGTRATLASDTFGTRWALNVTGAAPVLNASVQDSNAVTPIVANVPSLDAGNNIGWTFAPGGCLPLAPNGFLTEGATRPTTVGTTTPVFSSVNQSGITIDQERTQVLTTLPDGVVSLWHFDGTGADAVGSNTATTENGATTATLGHANFDRALTLDGVNDRASVPHASSISTTSDFTIEAWIKPTSLSLASTAVVLVKSGSVTGCGAASNCTYSLQYQGPFDRFCMTATRGGTQYQSCGSNRAALVDGEWHHVAGTVTGTNVMQLYVDGVAAGASASVGGAVDANASPLYVGTNGDASSPFPGQIDDVRLSSVARSAAEIKGYARTLRPHLTTMWDSNPSDLGSPVAPTCATGVRCANVTYGTGGGQLYLINDQARYYVRTKVRQAADGVWSAWGSDWFEVAAAINISASVPTINLGAVQAGTDVTAQFGVTVATNNIGGYSLTAKWNTQDLTSGGGATVPNFVPTAPELASTWTAGTTDGFGVTVLGADTAGVPYPRLARWGTGTDTLATDFVNNKYAGLAVANPLLLHRRSTYDAGMDTVDVAIRTNVSGTQAAGAYTSALVLTALANP